MPSTFLLPNLQDAYVRLRPVFYSALGRLAREGFVVAPADAQDLIHDFFVEAWTGLEERYQPSKGALEGYIYKAFVQFTRPRIIRLARVQSHLTDRTLLEGLAWDGPPVESRLDHRIWGGLLEEGIEALPPELRECLVLYCFEGKSERELARERRVSRYTLRERLIEALGRVVVKFPAPRDFGSAEWAIARAIWHEERTLSEAAKVLGITEHQASVGYRNCVRALSKVLKSSGKSRGGSKVNITAQMDALTVFRRALLSVGDEKALEAVKRRASEIMESLAVEDSEHLLPAAQMQAVDAHWLGRVYESLGDTGTALSGPELADCDSLFRARAEDARSVGAAFEQVLYAGLPAEFRRFEESFSELRPLDNGQREKFLSMPDVAEFERARALAKLGITPLMILRVTDGVAMLAERLIDRGLLRGDQAILLSVEDAEQKKEFQQLSYVMAVDEARRATRSDDLLARSILRWCVGVAQYVPLLFDGFKSTPETRFGVALYYSGDSEPDLYRRWLRNAYAPVLEQQGEKMNESVRHQ